VLRASNNRITLLSPDFGRLTRLENISLDGNPIRVIPLETAFLRNIKTLDIRHEVPI
jgi:hypothetical protein